MTVDPWSQSDPDMNPNFRRRWQHEWPLPTLKRNGPPGMAPGQAVDGMDRHGISDKADDTLSRPASSIPSLYRRRPTVAKLVFAALLNCNQRR